MSELLGRLLALLAVWRLLRRRRELTAQPEPELVAKVHEQLEDVSQRTVPANRRAERLVALLTDRERRRAMSVRARAMGKPGALGRIGAMAVELARRDGSGR